jgi:ABC-2 type transport system ATP-binding protein
VERVTRTGASLVLELTAQDAVPGVVRAVAALPGDLLGVAEEPPTLEEAYLRLVHDEVPTPTPAGALR